MSRTTPIRALLAGAALLALGAGASADEQYFPLQSYRVGPYAAGEPDSRRVHRLPEPRQRRDGGVNGVKLTWSEGETQYEVERGVEVYERLKSRPGIAAWNPLSVGIAYAMIDRVNRRQGAADHDQHGRTDSTDGRIFPYVFPLLLNPYSETSGIVEYLASREAGSTS